MRGRWRGCQTVRAMRDLRSSSSTYVSLPLNSHPLTHPCSPSDDTCAGGSGGGTLRYSGAEGRQRRKEAVSQLRSAVPMSWTYCLVDVLLDTGCMDPPTAAAAGGGGTGSTGASRASEQAWLAGVSVYFPHLQLLPAAT